MRKSRLTLPDSQVLAIPSKLFDFQIEPALLENPVTANATPTTLIVDQVQKMIC